MSKEDGLPKGWAMAKIADLVGLINGCAFKPTDWQDTGLPIVRIQNLNNPDAPFNYYPADELPEKFLIDTGDLLFAWSGTPGTSFGAHIWRVGRAWLNQHIFHVVSCRAHLDTKFLQLAINKNHLSHIPWLLGLSAAISKLATTRIPVFLLFSLGTSVLGILVGQAQNTSPNVRQVSLLHMPSIPVTY